MKTYLFLTILSLGTVIKAQTNGKVGINTQTPEGALDVVSTDSGLIPPRVANIGAVVSPVNGMVIYDNSSQCIKLYQNSYWSSCLGNSGGGAGFVVSDYKVSARMTDHNGWLLCDGRAVSRNTYVDLFQIIGTSFGAGDGATTFNLPDFAGRVAGGIGQGAGLENRALGANVGAETHKLTRNEIPNYSVTSQAVTAGTPSGSISSAGNHTHTVYGDTAGGVQGSNSTSGDTVLINGDGRSNNQTSGGGGAHSHTFSGSQLGTHSHTVSIGGGDGYHNNMQPTLFAGNYFIYGGT